MESLSFRAGFLPRRDLTSRETVSLPVRSIGQGTFAARRHHAANRYEGGRSLSFDVVESLELAWTGGVSGREADHCDCLVGDHRLARGMAQEHQHGNGEALGKVQFATSCNDPAQIEFNRAVALLHSFQFSRAIEGFDAVLDKDQTCGIAYWGIALSDWSNPFAPGQKDKRQLQLGRQSAERGKELGARTDRERAYLAAVSKLYSDFERTPQQMRLLAYRDA